MIFLKLGGILAIAIILIFFTTLAYFHIRTQQNELQKKFLAGKVPSPLPNGLYKGTVGGKEISWKGKKFDREHCSGINLFKAENSTTENYPFKTVVGAGAVDKNIQVLKIDYNQPGNSFFLKHVLDEVVEVSPDHFLGKLEVRILPNFYIALGYFELQKTAK
jgi:hypothetical protein